MISTLFKTIRSFGWNTRLMRWTVASLILCGALRASAQDSTPELDPVYTYEFNGLNEHFYSSDYAYDWLPNNTLSFKDILIQPDTGDLTPFSVMYDPYASHQAFSGLPAFPSVPRPAAVEGLPATFTTFLTTSPDGRFDLYSVAHARRDENGYIYSNPVLGIVDRTTGQYVKLNDINAWTPYDITWSANNEAVVITYSVGYGSLYYSYVTGFADDVTQAHGLMLTDWGPIAETLKWGIYQFYDLDSTGRYLLADGYLHNTDAEPGLMRLLVIDMQDLSYDVVAMDGYFRGAGFKKPDDQTVFYVNKMGVYAYDRQMDTQTLLTNKLNADDFVMDYLRFHPAFSPDGHYLAAQVRDKDVEFKIGVYPIAPIPEGK
jgi:hypothetical protein